jgi:hypothetical protein
MREPTRWRVLDEGLEWRHWDGEDEWVAFSPRSASVVLLNEWGHRLLALAADRARTIPEFVEALAGMRGVAEDPALAAAVTDTITHLDRAGLLEPGPSA